MSRPEENCHLFFFCTTRGFSYVFVHCQTQLTLVFWSSLLQAVFGGSHLICHLLLHDNWGNWTPSPWMWSARLLTIFSHCSREGAIGTWVQNGTWISFSGAMRWLVKTFSTRASEMFAAWLRNWLEVLKKRKSDESMRICTGKREII